jgi:hypothetical protein
MKQSKAYSLVPVADTNGQFSDFSSYVASINNDQVIAFQATLKNGVSGIFASKSDQIDLVLDSTKSNLKQFYSHPDINFDRRSCFYATNRLGDQGVYCNYDHGLITLASTRNTFKCIGPLGPTMNEEGKVAYRANFVSGGRGIFIGSHEARIVVADTCDRFDDFQGLPVINNLGTVVFRADLKNGEKGIFIRNGELLEVVVDTTGGFSDLGLFPMVNDSQTVAFNAALEAGGSGIFTATHGKITKVVDANDYFESFRGVLINNPGKIIYYATPKNGSLGIYCGEDPITDRIISIGDSLLGSTIVEFALNPVSINDRNQLAIRIKLADNTQLIVRADPGT